LCPKSYYYFVRSACFGRKIAMGLFDWLNHHKRLKELEDVVTKLAHRWDEQELHYIEIRARCKRLLDRDEKAVRALNERAVVDSLEPNTNGEAATSATQGMHIAGRLSEHQRQIQQQILKRRAGM
jgi:ribulose 1,5-bisphosphate carboxylase large subunit-like protein